MGWAFVKAIKLTRAKVAIVDDEDFPVVSRFRWFAHFNGRKWYAMRETAGQVIRMHRLILGADCDGKFVDHRNGDGLDNRRSNLRAATKSQNAVNRGARSNSKHGLVGISFDKRRKKWEAAVSPSGKKIHLGRFATKEEAARAYDSAALHHYGEFARLNFA